MKQKQDELIQFVRQMIYDILDDERLLQGEWQHGKVAEVISDKMLGIYVNGSTVVQKIPCNPSINFTIGDEVWVVYINRNSKDKFVLSKRGV